MSTSWDELATFWGPLERFVEHLKEQLTERWKFWATNHEQRGMHEVVGGLMARQTTLASEFTMNPLTWNEHSAPLFLRPMVENCITIAWILEAPTERTAQYISFGLGQENLLLEHAKDLLRKNEEDPEKDSDLRNWEDWLNRQRYTFLTQVDVGHWAGSDTRKMAEEVNLLDLYRHDYARWSAATHNMWNHLIKYNLRECRNPLHGRHRLPAVERSAPNTDFVCQAAEYIDIANRIFDESTQFERNGPTSLETLVGLLGDIRWPPQDPETMTAKE